jgi:hypothetical protein
VNARWIPVAVLRGLADPTKDWPWAEFDGIQHWDKIEAFYLNGWDDPISIDVGIPHLGYYGPAWPITDGNHRFYAAILRGDETILACVSGCVPF